MRRPSPAGAAAIGVAFATWVGALAGLVVGVPAIAVCAAGSVGSLAFRQRVAAIGLAFAVAGSLSGTLAAARIESTLTAPVPSGRIEFVGRVVEDAAGPDRPAVVVPEAVEREGSWRDWYGPPLGVRTIDETDLVAGDVIRVSGTIQAAPPTDPRGCSRRPGRRDRGREDRIRGRASVRVGQRRSIPGRGCARRWRRRAGSPLRIPDR